MALLKNCVSLTFLYIEFICQLSNSICQLLLPFDMFT